MLGFFGGVERHVHDLAVGLRARGHRVALAHGEPRGREPDRYRAAFDNVVPLAESDAIARRAGAVYAHKLSPEQTARLTQPGVPLALAVHDHDLTCVRSHRYLPISHEPCARAPGLACVAHGCVLVRCRARRLGVSIRNPFSLTASTRALSRRVMLVAGSAFVRATLLDAGVAPDRVAVIHPVPPEDTAPLVPAPDDAVVVFAGQLVRGKGLDILLRAVATQRSTRLLVAGAGPGLSDAEALCARLEIRHRVELLGAVAPERMRRVYDRARLLAVPSRWPEPFGMVGVEAMRRARPAVAARHGGIPEWLTDGVTGWAFEPGSVQDLARALDEALNGPGYARIATAALEAAATRFSFSRMLEQVEALLLGGVQARDRIGAEGLTLRGGAHTL
jgi:glycosyltransferase involved in cell wall biosynthesis